jgi:competence ComEA-like helix-hairpin-helix protein
VTTIPPPETKGQNVRVIVSDVVKQLGAGRVAMPLSELLAAVPREYVQAAALNDSSPIALPLRAVVNALNPSLFKQYTTQAARAYRTEGIPDFFLRLALRRDAWPSASEPATPPAEALVTPPADEPSETAADMERLGGVNLNTAGVEQLLRLDKVTRTLADEIVKYRSEHGPFKSVFDLFDVPRVGRKTFRAITGMPYNLNRRHRGRRLVALLGLPPSEIAHLPSLAAALARKPGFVGCVISDKDGLLLAQHGVDRLAETVSAVAPRLMRDAISNMKELGAHNVDSLSIHGEGSLFTVIPAGDVFMTAFHQTARLTGGQLRLIGRVAVELQWLVSRRGYVLG